MPRSVEDAPGVRAEPAGDLREDRLRGVDEDPPPGDVAHGRVVAHGVAHEVGQLGQGLDPRVARAHEHEREVALGLGPDGALGGQLELAEHVVAQVDRVGERLEAQAVLGQARDGRRRVIAPIATTSWR